MIHKLKCNWFVFRSAGCRSQTGASSSQRRTSVASSTHPWSPFTRTGTRSCTLAAGPKTRTLCWTAAAAVRTTSRPSCRIPRYSHLHLLSRPSKRSKVTHCIPNMVPVSVWRHERGRWSADLTAAERPEDPETNRPRRQSIHRFRRL